MEEIAKPRELLACRASSERLFTLLKNWFDVPSIVTVNVSSIDAGLHQHTDPRTVMAMAMHRLQALHLLTTPGVRTTTDVVLTVIQDLERALLQAPLMHLRSEVADTDWDAELAELSDELGDDETLRADEEVRDAGLGDIERFRLDHRRLRLAAKAVLRASSGQIRVLV